MTSPKVPLPSNGNYIESIRESCRSQRERANITVNTETIKRLLFSPSFTGTYERLRVAHGMVMPLNFPSLLAELNVLSLLSLLNFASGYRVPLHQATGRGAFDNIRAFVFSLYISSSVGDEGDLLSARGMQGIQEGKVADLMGVATKIHIDKPHASIPGVTVGELGGPIWEVVEMVTKVMRETGDVLVTGGYQDLGAFVLEALKEGDRVKSVDSQHRENAGCNAILEQLVRAIPGFQDMAMVDGQPVYCFKKALLTLHAITLRFGRSREAAIPIPRTDNLPIFSDNVIPSMLVHLGVIDLSTSDPSIGLGGIFSVGDEEMLNILLGADPDPSKNNATGKKEPPREGPILTTEQAFILRASAIDACELIVQTARGLKDEELLREDGKDLRWLRSITLPELDAWLWAVAKDRSDYRALERFVLRRSTFF